MNCGNCSKPINLPVSPNDFALNEHLCDECQKGALTLRLVLVRGRAGDPWRLESSQPLRNSFNVE